MGENKTSEELIQRKLTEHGKSFGPYEFYSIGGVTLNQLKSYNIVPIKKYEQYGSRKPDFLLVDRRNKNDIRVIICGESKQPEEFLTETQKKIAIESCNDIAQEINAPIGLATDWNTFVWFNPKQEASSNHYADKTTEVFYFLPHSVNFLHNFLITAEDQPIFDCLIP